MGDLGGVHGTNDALVLWRYAQAENVWEPHNDPQKNNVPLKVSQNCALTSARTDLRRALIEVPRCRRKNEAKRDAGARTPETLGVIREPPGHRMRGSERARRMYSRCSEVHVPRPLHEPAASRCTGEQRPWWTKFLARTLPNSVQRRAM